MKCNRIFIEDLPEAATESEIHSTFSEFGVVTSIEIKKRKSVTFRNSSCYFSYINLEASESRLQNCFQYFNETPWHGQHVKLKIAKESFLERLKREREAAQNNSLGAETGKPLNEPIKIDPENKFARLNGKQDISKQELNGVIGERKKRKISTSSSSSESGKDVKNVSKLSNINLKKEEPVPSDVIYKNNKYKLIDKKLKIEGVGKEPILKIEIKKNKPRSLDKFRAQADVKRKDSLLVRRKAYSHQKNAIQAALSHSNINKSNKIVFDDNEEVGNVTENQTIGDKSKKALFDEEDSDSDDPIKTFELKEKFQGKAGEKLLKLQSTFKNDKRFSLNEKFLEDEENVDDDFSFEQEKNKEFEILGEILGREVKSKIKSSDQFTRPENELKVMRRFDPSQPDHSKYEKQKEDKKPNAKKKDVPFNDKKVEDKEEPEVSKEIFYAVKDDLKKTLKGDQGFSLLSMFGTSTEKEVSPEDKEVSIGKKKYPVNENPFKYDSSDDEDQTDQLSEKKKPVSFKAPSTIKAWTEPFFFKEDDFRLQEGMDFVKKIATEEKEDFVQVRKNLKEIVKNKVRSNLRKNRPFKKKLGGNRKKKTKRINKALSR